MGFFEDLFDFDGDGKVGFDDDLMFMWITHNATSQKAEKKRADDSRNLYLAAAADEEAESMKRAAVEAQKKAQQEAAQRKLQHELNEIRQEMYAVRLPYKTEHKEMAKKAAEAYKALTTRLHKVMPQDDGSLFYFDCIELEHEIKGFIDLAEKIYQIFNGDFHDDTDSLAAKASEVAELERRLAEWELKEPDDCWSEAWDAWDEKKDELQNEVDVLKEELEEDSLFESIMEESDTQRYLNAYSKSTKALEQAQLSVERWEQLVRIGKRIFQEVEQLIDEQGTALNDAVCELEIAEPKEDSPNRKSWQKRLDELNGLIKRIEQIDCSWWNDPEHKKVR